MDGFCRWKIDGCSGREEKRGERRRRERERPARSYPRTHPPPPRYALLPPPTRQRHIMEAWQTVVLGFLASQGSRVSFFVIDDGDQALTRISYWAITYTYSPPPYMNYRGPIFTFYECSSMEAFSVL
jgi:hypothetical protein